MCDHTNDPGGREAAMVEAYPGAWCDPCIAPLVRALNEAGIKTVASCCGHGKRPGKITLADGRELFILADFDSARALDDLLLASQPVEGERSSDEEREELTLIALALKNEGIEDCTPEQGVERLVTLLASYRSSQQPVLGQGVEGARERRLEQSLGEVEHERDEGIEALAALVVAGFEEDFPGAAGLDAETAALCWITDVAEAISRKDYPAVPALLPDPGVHEAADRLRAALSQQGEEEGGAAKLRAALEEIVRIYNDDSLSNSEAQDRTDEVARAALDSSQPQQQPGCETCGGPAGESFFCYGCLEHKSGTGKQVEDGDRS